MALWRNHATLSPARHAWASLAHRARCGSDRASCGSALGASGAAAFHSHPEAHVHVPLVVPALSTKAQSQAWNVPSKTRFPCPPKYGAGYLGADGRYVPQREDRLYKPLCNLSISSVGGTLLKNKLLIGGC